MTSKSWSLFYSAMVLLTVLGQSKPCLGFSLLPSQFRLRDYNGHGDNSLNDVGYQMFSAGIRDPNGRYWMSTGGRVFANTNISEITSYQEISDCFSDYRNYGEPTSLCYIWTPYIKQNDYPIEFDNIDVELVIDYRPYSIVSHMEIIDRRVYFDYLGYMFSIPIDFEEETRFEDIAETQIISKSVGISTRDSPVCGGPWQYESTGLLDGKQAIYYVVNYGNPIADFIQNGNEISMSSKIEVWVRDGDNDEWIFNRELGSSVKDNGILSSHIDYRYNLIYFGTSFGKFLVYDLTNPSTPVFLSDFDLDYMDVTSIVPYTWEEKNSIFLSFRWSEREISLLTELKVVEEDGEYNFEIEFMLPSTSSIRDLAVYQERSTLFILDEFKKNTMVHRFHIERSEFTGEVVLNDENYKYFSLLFTPEDNLIIAGDTRHNENSNQMKLMYIRVGDCEIDSCQTCISSDDFCGACYSNTKDLYGEVSCGLEEQCSENWVSQSSLCPEITYYSKESGSIEGSTVVEIIGTLGFDGDVKCYFGENEGDINVVDDTLYCTSPEYNNTGIVPLKVTLDGLLYPEEEDWNYYDCSEVILDSYRKCGDCFSMGDECGICFNDFTCKSSKRCGADFESAAIWNRTSSCPSIQYYDPVGIPANDATVDSVIVAVIGSIDPSLDYKCKILEEISDAEYVTKIGDYHQFRCEVLPGPYSKNGVNVQILLNHNAMDIQVTFNSKKLPYYDCDDKFILCESCIDYEKCTFDGQTCAYGTSDVQDKSLICPTITGLSEDKDHISGGTSLVIYVKNFGSSFIEYCYFYNVDENISYNTSATNGITEVICSTPVDALPGQYQLQITYLGTPITALYPFEIYDCNFPSCIECAPYNKCIFCASSMVCNYTGETECNATLTNDCPALLSVTSVGGESAPLIPGETLTGESLIEINSKNILLARESNPSVIYRCYWEGNEDNRETAATVSLNEVTCFTPGGIENSAIYKLYVKANDDILTNSLNFQFYDCSKDIPRTDSFCGSCINQDFPRCTYCNHRCIPKTECPNSVFLDSCPYVDSIFPSAVRMGETLSISTASNYEDGPSSSYTSLFSNGENAEETSCELQDSQTLLCDVPQVLNVEKRDLIPGNYTLTVNLNGVDYFPDEEKATISLFDCGIYDQCTDECFTEHCGYCLGTGLCQGEYECEGTWTQSCGEISVDTPYASVSGNQSFLVNVSKVDTTALAAEDIICHYSNIQIPANSTNITNTYICPTPSYLTETITSLSLSYHDKIFTAPISLRFLECYSIESCADCRIKPGCGWCMYENVCTAEKSCNKTVDWQESSCPEIDFISPFTGFTGETVDIYGSYFYDEVRVYFGEVEAEYTFIDSNNLQATAPPHSDGTQVDVVVYSVENEPYTNGERFTYGSRIGVILAGILIPLFIIIIAAVLIWYFKFRGDSYDTLSLTLEEPDYFELAYPITQLSATYDLADEDYLAFKDLLFGDDSSYFKAFISTLAPSDTDKAALSIIHMTETYGKSVDFLNIAISNEINLTEHTGTIFRGNSISSKMFKNFARINGLPYLFNTLAIYCAQIDLQAREAAEMENDGTNLMAISLELDENKLDRDSYADLEANSYKLQMICQKMFTSIFKSIDDIPKEFRMIFEHINNEIIEKFPLEDEAVFFAVGGLFFLRYVIPSIFAPHVYGILTEPPNQDAQRQLVLISKVLQCVANMTTPGKKEEYMDFMNPFITKNIPKIVDFYTTLMEPTHFEDEGTNFEVPLVCQDNAVAFLYSLFHKNQKKIKNYLQEMYFGNEAAEYLGTVDEIILICGDKPARATVEDKKSKRKTKH
eukprot:TRINITY_DN3003_c0_g2_i1.p1 TRINITY_DN3003_c0_g2~~TRINITY_DN3003_c0_g2_i1.p1  ORF type:complete len:1830 (+),score=358.39 TRINITY_DN3003_c0_g2_i1:36-5492(+)